jgi:hypothetical protein
MLNFQVRVHNENEGLLFMNKEFHDSNNTALDPAWALPSMESHVATGVTYAEADFLLQLSTIYPMYLAPSMKDSCCVFG